MGKILNTEVSWRDIQHLPEPARCDGSCLDKKKNTILTLELEIEPAGWLCVQDSGLRSARRSVAARELKGERGDEAEGVTLDDSDNG